MSRADRLRLPRSCWQLLAHVGKCPGRGSQSLGMQRLSAKLSCSVLLRFARRCSALSAWTNFFWESTGLDSGGLLYRLNRINPRFDDVWICLMFLCDLKPLQVFPDSGQGTRCCWSPRSWAKRTLWGGLLDMDLIHSLPYIFYHIYNIQTHLPVLSRWLWVVFVCLFVCSFRLLAGSSVRWFVGSSVRWSRLFVGWLVGLFVAVTDINCLLMRSHSQPWWSGHCAFFASPTPPIFRYGWKGQIHMSHTHIIYI